MFEYFRARAHLADLPLGFNHPLIELPFIRFHAHSRRRGLEGAPGLAGLSEDVLDPLESRADRLKLGALTNGMHGLDSSENIGWIIGPGSEHGIDFVIDEPAMPQYEAQTVFIKTAKLLVGLVRQFEPRLAGPAEGKRQAMVDQNLDHAQHPPAQSEWVLRAGGN